MPLSGSEYGLTTWKGLETGLSSLNLLRICASGSHADLLAFLATAQIKGIDFLPLVWYPAYYLGRGGFAVLNQSPVKAEFSFAFKRLGDRSRDQDEETEDFSLAISEVTILMHKPIASHPNIVELQGTCWEVNTEEDRILPVLVFEKSTYGDMLDFRDTQEAKKLTLLQKVSLCSQILDAIHTLHASRIIHGDVKPSNILVSNDRSGGLVAKVADFGHSVIFSDKSDMCHLPSSEPWTAPEWHHREHSFAQARSMDIYSFALVCFWLLMSESFTSIDSKSAVLAIRDYKRSGSLVDEACKLINSLDAANSLKEGLKNFFRMTLSSESRKALRSIAKLMPLIDPDRQRSWVKTSGAKLSHEVYHAEFSISNNFYVLLFTNYVVRKVIVENLREKAKSSLCSICKENAAFQLAFCYYVGFGIKSDHEMAQYWVENVGRELGDLEEEKDEVVDFCLYSNKRVIELHHDGFTMVMDHVSEYRRADYDFTIVTKAYREEIIDLERAFTNDPLVTATLRATLANILVGQGNLREAEELYRQLIDFCLASDEHGPEHSLTLGSLTNLGHIIQEQGRMKEAGQMFRKVLATRTTLLGSEHPKTLESGTSLASLLFWTEDLHEARNLLESILEARERVLGPNHLQTLQTITNLACVYHGQALYSRAQELNEQVLAVKKRILGDEAHETINSMANLALNLVSQGFYEKGEKLEREVLEMRKRFLGENNPVTLVAKTNLATTCFQQARLGEAERLETEVLQARQQQLGRSHWLTLSSMNNLLNTQIEQGRIEACEQNLTALLQASLDAPELNLRLRSRILENAKKVCSLYEESVQMHALLELENQMLKLQ